MSDPLYMSPEIVIVLFLPPISMPINIWNLIHDKMDMHLVRVVMDSIDSFIFRCIMLDNFTRIVICLRWSNMFPLVEANNWMSDSLALVLTKSNSGFLHFHCCRISRCHVATSYKGCLLWVANIVDSVLIGVPIKKFAVFTDPGYFIRCHQVIPSYEYII